MTAAARHDTSMQVVRTYLVMDSPGQLVPVDRPRGDARVERLSRCPASFYRYLYSEVGRAHRWHDRLPWSDERITGHVARDGLTLWLCSLGGAPAGYFELERHGDDGSMEIAYFGLLPDVLGQGLGGWLLSEAVTRAWAEHAGVSRVWLHTCTLDHPAALPNYVARGFRVWKTERYEVED